jgi:hypothetical protein
MKDEHSQFFGSIAAALYGPDTERGLIERSVYAGLPPAARPIPPPEDHSRLDRMNKINGMEKERAEQSRYQLL